MERREAFPQGDPYDSRQRADTAPHADLEAPDDATLRLSYSDLQRSQSWTPQEQLEQQHHVATRDGGNLPFHSTLKRRNSAAKSLSPPPLTAKQSTTNRLPSLNLDPDFTDHLSTLQFMGEEQDGNDTSAPQRHQDERSGRRATTENSSASSSSSLWARLRRLFMHSQPGFYDLHDPVRRKQQGAELLIRRNQTQKKNKKTRMLTPATAHLPYRYQALMLSDHAQQQQQEHEDEQEEEAEDAQLMMMHLPFDIDDVDLHNLLSAERAQMTELTVSVFESTWVFLLLHGVLSSLIAWSVDGAVLVVIDLHDKFTKLGGAWLPNYILYTVFRVFILLLGVTCTFFVCPNAAGSGIPEMRSILGGFPFPNYLRGRTLVAKAMGLVCALGSGLSIGKEGPFVHLSCVIAHQLLRIPLFKQIRLSQDLTHHVLSAACAVGVTATFGTPIGGVLFSIEVTTTYYVTSNYWRAFFSSVVGVVVFRQLNSLLSGNNVSLFTTQFAVLPYKSYEMTFFLLLAAICGLLAAFFVKLYRFIVKIKTKMMARLVSFITRGRATTGRRSSPTYEPFVYAACVALVFALIEFPVGSFMLLSQREIIDDMFSEGNLTSTSTDADPTHLFTTFGSQWTSPSLALNLIAYIAVRFVSTAVSATVMVPSGIATPVFAIGAVVGRLFGEMIVFFGGGHELAGGYAVVGAASFTAGITGTVSIAVIVFELTSQLSYMVPVLLSVLVGRSVAMLFSLDIYETISREKNLPQWPDLSKQKSYSLVASDLMRGLPANWLDRKQTLTSLRKLLQETPRETTLFPVIDDQQTMVYLGVAERDELDAVVEQWQQALVRGSSSGSLSGSSPFASGVLYGTETETETKSEEYSITPRSREVAMASQLALAGVTPAQGAALSHPQSEATQPIDLVALGLLNLDAGNFHVHRDTYASQVILLISVHKSPQLFVTARGKLIGVVHAADLLARSRRFTL